MPPEFKVMISPIEGPANGFTVYTFDGDGPSKSNCAAKLWQPVLAPEVGSRARKDWSVVQREVGVHQWAYRKKPLYCCEA